MDTRGRLKVQILERRWEVEGEVRGGRWEEEGEKEEQGGGWGQNTVICNGV